jgi:hypothetical protein
MEVAGLSETSATIYQTMWNHIRKIINKAWFLYNAKQAEGQYCSVHDEIQLLKTKILSIYLGPNMF